MGLHRIAAFVALLLSALTSGSCSAHGLLSVLPRRASVRRPASRCSRRLCAICARWWGACCLRWSRRTSRAGRRDGVGVVLLGSGCRWPAGLPGTSSWCGWPGRSTWQGRLLMRAWVALVDAAVRRACGGWAVATRRAAPAGVVCGLL